MKKIESINDLDKALSRAFLNIIAERGLKKFKVAEVAGIENGYLSELLNGKKRWNTTAILAVCRALNVEVQDIMSGEVLSHEDRKDLELIRKYRSDKKSAVDLS